MSTRREFLTQAAATTLATSTAAAAGTSSQATVAAGSAPPSGRAGAMKTYTVPQTDLVVSRLAYGCAMIGVDSNTPEFIPQTITNIRAAADQGITLFDTADVYGGGKSELALGQTLKESPGLRHRVVIQTKCAMVEGGAIDNTRGHIAHAVEGSLKRLGTNRIDILLLHWPDNLVQPQEVAQAFDDLHRAGKVGCFGVSNHSPYQIELLRGHVQQPIVINQIQLGLAHWYTEATPDKGAITHGAEGVVTLDYCRAHGIQVQAYSPLKPESVGKPPNLLNPAANAPPGVRSTVEALQQVARAHDASPAAIMLAWLLHHPAGILPIIGATKPAHVIDNCAADRIELSRSEWYTLLRAAARIEQHA